MAQHLYAVLALTCVAGSFGFAPFSTPMLKTSGSQGASASFRPIAAATSGNSARRIQRSAAVMMAYGMDNKPKASKELVQVRFAKPDPDGLMAFIQKWPTGTSKDKFGLPKLMLPVSWEKLDDGPVQGLKLIFKGSLDPWLQVQIEGDCVRVYRCSGLTTTSLQVSALKEREEGKICDKLKTDLSVFGETKEYEIPVIKPVRDEPVEAAEDKEETEAAPPS